MCVWYQVKRFICSLLAWSGWALSPVRYCWDCHFVRCAATLAMEAGTVATVWAGAAVGS